MKKVIICLFLLGLGGWWFWQQNPSWLTTVEQYVASGEFLTLETKYSPERLMQEHRQELLSGDQSTFQDPVLKFVPYLLIDAKFVYSDKKTREGSILWSQLDGEMVLDTDTWETTHGFEDSIQAGASRADFKILLALAKNRGTLTRQELQQELHLEAEVIEPWIESVIQKYLVVQEGSHLQLHMHNPHIFVIPQTRIKQAFVTRSLGHSEQIPRQYSQSQIEKIAKAAFGPTFTIRNIKEVFLPVYSISVLNPDATILTTHWNALNGQRLDH